MSIEIWHNPRCSKSRQTMELLTSRGIEPNVRLYQDDAPSIEEIKAVMKKLGIDDPRAMMRTKDDLYKELGLGDAAVSADDLIEAMHAHPKLIERPIVINGEKARIGRPPEQVLEIL